MKLTERKYVALRDEITRRDDLNREANRATRFRQRTLGSDPQNQARVRIARLRAKRTITPEPRR